MLAGTVGRVGYIIFSGSYTASQGYNSYGVTVDVDEPQLYYRNLLYTAVTRAKKILIMVGNTSTLKKMVDNNKRTARYTGLKAFLEGGAAV